MRKAIYITALIGLFLVAPAWLLTSWWYEESLLAEQHSDAEERLFHNASMLSNAIQKRFALLEGLYAFVIANPTEEQLRKHFFVFASALKTGVDGIRNFGLAPDGVMKYVYPIHGNKAAVGHDLLHDQRPNVRADVQRTIESRKITLSGPYQLRQGGLGLVARKAVYIGDDFWGLATMVIDVPPVLAEAGLNDSERAGSSGLRTEGGRIFFGEADAFAEDPIIILIDLPDGHWELAFRGQGTLLPHFAKQLHVFELVSAAASFFFLFLVYSIASRQSYLAAKVKEQTQDLQDELYERQRVEEALIESEERVRELIEHSPIGLVLCRMDGTLVSVNSAFADIIGYQCEEALHLSYWDITPGPYAPQEKQVLEELEQNGRYGPYEKEYRHKNGHLVPVRLNGLLVSRNGEHFIWSSVEDISALKAAEKEKALLSAQLQQAQKMEAIGTLAGGVAHDFNNILSAIVGYTELSLRNPACDAKIEKNLSNVLTAADRAKNLVRQILMFSRKGERELKPLSLQTLVHEAAKLLRNAIPANIDLKMDVDPETGVVLADATQVHQIVMNLCTNAFHALQDRGGEMTLGLHPVHIDAETAARYQNLKVGDYALLSVADTGDGIPPGILPRIFDPFFTTKTPEKGTGMGLAVVHGAVENHGGFIEVKSRVGQGTTFEVFLPLLKEAQAEQEEPEIDDSPEPAGKARILWVDDEAMLVALAEETLAPLGYRVTTTTSAREAFAWFSDDPQRYDLLVTDQTMPELSGDELAQKVMRIRPDFPVIICTGHSHIMDEEKAAAIGVKALLMKPLERKQLLGAIRQALDG